MVKKYLFMIIATSFLSSVIKSSNRIFVSLEKNLSCCKIKDNAVFQYRGTGKAAISSENCFLVALWVFAISDSYRSISQRLAISKSTAVSCVRGVFDSIMSDVCENVMKLPRNKTQREEEAFGFQRIAGIKKVIGAMYGCHILIRAPKKDKEVYCNKKNNYSLVVQGVCNSVSFFIDVDIRWTGSIHELRAFRTPDLFQYGETVCENGYLIIFDSAYPLKIWVIRPYRRRLQMNPKQALFNKILSKSRVVIERSFGFFKNRFRRLFYLHMLNISDSIKTIMVCCVLHNICMSTDVYAETLIFGDCCEDQDEDVEENNPSKDAKIIRLEIANHLCGLSH